VIKNLRSETEFSVVLSFGREIKRLYRQGSRLLNRFLRLLYYPLLRAVYRRAAKKHKVIFSESDATKSIVLKVLNNPAFAKKLFASHAIGVNKTSALELIKKPEKEFKELVQVNWWAGQEDFKSCFTIRNMPVVIAALKEGLDHSSRAVVDQRLTHFLNFPLHRTYANHFRADTREILYTDQDRKERDEFRRARASLMERYKGSYTPDGRSDARNPESFYYHHGLKFVGSGVLEYLRGKSLLDIGAYFGESSVALSEYGFSKIHMFELIKSVKERIAANILANGLDSAKYVFHNMGLSDQTGEIIVSDDTEPNISNNITSANNPEGVGYNVPISTIDEFFSGTDEKIGMIKMDVEGEGLSVIRGAVKTIKKYRPVMSIGIYHCPSEFFDIKPYLETYVGGYKFVIRNLNVHSGFGMETTLICIPESVED
jgi:FkbM family methyltransferase